MKIGRCRLSLFIWPVGQAVKTAASHAVNMGSIPVRVTKLDKLERCALWAQVRVCFLFSAIPRYNDKRALRQSTLSAARLFFCLASDTVKLGGVEDFLDAPSNHFAWHARYHK